MKGHTPSNLFIGIYHCRFPTAKILFLFFLLNGKKFCKTLFYGPFFNYFPIFNTLEIELFYFLNAENVTKGFLKTLLIKKCFVEIYIFSILQIEIFNLKKKLLFQTFKE